MNNDNPLVSVIVLTYNQEDTIARTLDSILAQQTTHHYEIVIGEDGGTDGTRAICEEYVRQHPDIVRLMPKAANKGVVRNYFDTLRQCRGELIADCAGDDYWCDRLKLQKQADLLLQHPEASVVHSSYKACGPFATISTNSKNSKTSKTSTALTTLPQSRLVRAIALQTTEHVIHLCTATYRKGIVLDALASDPDLFSPRWRCEDLQIAYVLAKAGQVLYMPEPTLHYTVGRESVSSPTSELKMFEFFLSATDLSYEIVRREQLTGRDVDTYFQNRIFALLMHLLRANCPNRLSELKAHITHWQQPLSTHNHLLSICLTHTPLRYALLFLRHIYVSAKSITTKIKPN